MNHLAKICLPHIDACAEYFSTRTSVWSTMNQQIHRIPVRGKTRSDWPDFSEHSKLSIADAMNVDKCHIEDMIPFPEYLFAYGIYYDEIQIVILVHYPELYERRDKDGINRRAWRFIQAPVAYFEIGLISPESAAARWPGAVLTADRWDKNVMMERFCLVVALLTVRRHAEELEEKLKQTIGKYNKSL